MSRAYYGVSFYEGLMGGSLRSAQIVLEKVFGMYRPESIVDFGCGVGTWLKAAQDLGVHKVLGIDGSHVDQKLLCIPAERFASCNLSREVPRLQERFDMAISLEVAEHLPEEAAGRFVNALVSASDVVLFSAAVPDQGGRYHINEQFPSYWIRLFESHGYRCFDPVRPLVWSDARVEVWYRQNILIFAKERSFPGLRSAPEDYDVIHPDLWRARGKLGRRLDRLATNARHLVSRVMPDELVSRIRKGRGEPG